VTGGTGPQGHGQFHRIAEAHRRPVVIRIDGEPVTALVGDTLLTALLIHGRRVRSSEFGDGARAGFCVMGACQDCWVTTAEGERLRACTTFVRDGLAIVTAGAAEAP
jgi:predicted molibdopterin-dependent oxidoreductase YjgC